jgi:AraC family transcriptional regulator
MNSMTHARPVSYTRSSTAELHEKAVMRVIELLRSDPSRTWSIRDMARAAFMSPFHFIRVFQEVAGIPPCKFQWALKLHTAKQLLLLTNMSILDTSRKVGYSSLGTFTRRFSELVGFSPNRFRHFAKTAHSAEFQRAMDGYAPPAACEPALTGRVHPPPRFRGTIILACFASRIPQGRPLQYAVADSSQIFRVRRPGHRNFYLHAFGIPRSDANTCWFSDEHMLRGDIRCVVSTAADHVPEELFLRDARPSDPPVLLAMGVLASHRFFAGDRTTDQEHAIGPAQSSCSLGAASGMSAR